jgi:hypothetical protein
MEIQKIEERSPRLEQSINQSHGLEKVRVEAFADFFLRQI